MREEPGWRGEGRGAALQQLGWSVLHFMSLSWSPRVACASVSPIVEQMILQATLPFFFFFLCKMLLSLG